MSSRASPLALLASAVVWLPACGDGPVDGTQAYGSGAEMVEELLADGLVCFNVSGAEFEGDAVECDLKDTTVRFVIWGSATERDETVADLRSTLDELSVPYCLVVGRGAEATWSVDVEVNDDDFCSQVAAVYGVADPIRG
jgi:hypothetical protein